jgi:uncharacterized protein (DUF1778 family)
MGRPKLRKADKLSKRFTFLVTVDEAEQVKAASKVMSTGISGFLRHVAVNASRSILQDHRQAKEVTNV